MNGIEEMVSLDRLRDALLTYVGAQPFDHCVVDGFFSDSVARELAREFIDYDSSAWFVYDNPIEHKLALNDWNKYPGLTYRALTYLCSPSFVDALADSLRLRLYADPGLHGGGWHMHGNGGNLNPHLDYHLHPKLQLVRKLNLIVYLAPELIPSEHGGHLGLWAHDAAANRPGELVTEIEPIFNRAVLFDTTQNSWHGMSRTLSVPNGVYRKSLAIYYLTDATAADFSMRQRAMFAPRESQRGSEEVERIISARMGVETSASVYVSDKKGAGD